MAQRPTSVLLVENDESLADMIIDHLERSMSVRITHVGTAAEAVCSQMSEPHDVVLIDLALPDCGDLSLARELKKGADSEVIVMTDTPSLGKAVEAMRLGVRDMLTKPFDVARLSSTLQNAAESSRQRVREHLRNERLRRVSGRIIRERRLMRQRVDLVCRDLVGAYRRLAEKVVAQRETAN